MSNFGDDNLYLGSMECCGTIEMDGLEGYENHPQQALDSFVSGRERFKYDYDLKRNVSDGLARTFAFLIFTQAVEIKNQRSYGNQFADLIRKKRLGRVTKSVPAVNPNTDSWVTVFIWRVNWDKLEAYAKTLKKVD